MSKYFYFKFLIVTFFVQIASICMFEHYSKYDNIELKYFSQRETLNIITFLICSNIYLIFVEYILICGLSIEFMLQDKKIKVE